MIINISVYGIAAFLAGISNTLFGAVVYIRNRKNLSNRLFGLISLGFAIWTFSYFTWLLQDNSDNALFWSRMLNFGATLIPIFYLHWILSILNIHKKRKKILIAGYILTGFFVLFSFSHWYIKEVTSILQFRFWPQAGILYTLFMFINYIGFVSYGFYELFVHYFKTEGNARKQIKYVIYGSLVGFLGGATNFPLMYGIEISPPYGMFLTIFSPIIFAYAVTKYHLFNIKVITTELFGALLSAVLLINAVLSVNFKWFILNILLFFGAVIFTILLIRSVLKEVRLREEIELLAKTLEAANIKLRRLDKAKSEFISIASHQLRTPLTAIMGYASMLLEGDYGPLDDKQKEQIKIIYVSSTNLIRLVNSLLTLSRMEAGRLEFDFEVASMEEAVKEVMEEFIPLAASRSLYLKYHKPVKPLPKIKMDVLKMKLVIQNLLDNAIHYTQQGGVDVWLKKEDRKLVLTVKDSGIGILAEDKSIIFEKFSRGKGVSKLHTGGTGIGLYLVSKIVEAHHGRVWFESAGQDQGATFYVELPL